MQSRNLSSFTINHQHPTVRQVQNETATLHAQNNQFADLIAENQCKKIFSKELEKAKNKAESHQPYGVDVLRTVKDRQEAELVKLNSDLKKEDQFKEEKMKDNNRLQADKLKSKNVLQQREEELNKQETTLARKTIEATKVAAKKITLESELETIKGENTFFKEMNESCQDKFDVTLKQEQLDPLANLLEFNDHRTDVSHDDSDSYFRLTDSMTEEIKQMMIKLESEHKQVLLKMNGKEKENLKSQLSQIHIEQQAKSRLLEDDELKKMTENLDKKAKDLKKEMANLEKRRQEEVYEYENKKTMLNEAIKTKQSEITETKNKMVQMTEESNLSMKQIVKLQAAINEFALLMDKANSSHDASSFGSASTVVQTGKGKGIIAPRYASSRIAEPTKESVEMQQRLKTAKAGRSKIKGSIAISLTWEHDSIYKRNDLDLWVTCPSGEKIGFSKMKSSCNGILDTDRKEDALKPVENIVWKENAPKGEYVIKVHNFSANHWGEMPFKVGLVIDGGEMEMFDRVMPGEHRKWVEVTRFQYK